MAKETNNNSNPNMKFWELLRAVPDNAKKPIQDGKLKGKTDINPVWRIKALTEQFGPCGKGWHYETVERWADAWGGELIANVRIKLFIHPDGETPWVPIEGIGGSKVFGAGKGKACDDEAWKMATTDAISVACKSLGMAADVYYAKDAEGGSVDRWSKYDAPYGQDASPYPQGTQTWQPPVQQGGYAPGGGYPQQGYQGPSQPGFPCPVIQGPAQQGYQQGGYQQAPQGFAPQNVPQGPVQAPVQTQVQAAPPQYAEAPGAAPAPGFDENNPAIAKIVARLSKFQKGTPTFQTALNDSIGELSGAGFRVFDPGFMQMLIEAAQARREGRAPNYANIQ